jgi:hypothetical protein
VVKDNLRRKRKKKMEEEQGNYVRSHVRVNWNKSATVKCLSNVKYVVENYRSFNVSDIRSNRLKTCCLARDYLRIHSVDMTVAVFFCFVFLNSRSI